MAHASRFRELNTRGRYEVALACVHRRCDGFGLSDGFVRQEIEAHWDMPIPSRIYSVGGRTDEP